MPSSDATNTGVRIVTLPHGGSATGVIWLWSPPPGHGNVKRCRSHRIPDGIKHYDPPSGDTHPQEEHRLFRTWSVSRVGCPPRTPSGTNRGSKHHGLQ
jgi:hypothetical protein